MTSLSSNFLPIKHEFTKWINSNSCLFTITNDLQMACLDESLEEFSAHFPEYTHSRQKDHEMRWILNKWIGNFTLVLDSSSVDVVTYRGIEIRKKRLEEIKQPLLNEIRKMVSACYRSRIKFLN